VVITAATRLGLHRTKLNAMKRKLGISRKVPDLGIIFVTYRADGAHLNPSALDNSISSLEKVISGLESSVDSLDFWLWASTAIVVIGVALELYFVINEYRSGRNAWLRASIRSPEKPNRWIFSFELLSIVLVVLGVAGELVVGIISADRNAELRNKNRLLVGFIDQKAADAQERANGLEQSNKELGVQQEELKSDNLELEALIQPRTLSAKQQQDLTMATAPFKHHAVSIFSYASDAEAARLGLQIAAALTKSEVKVVPRFGALIMVKGMPGEGVSISNIDPGLAQVIHNSLFSAHIASVINPKRDDEKEMTVTIGVKPTSLEESLLDIQTRVSAMSSRSTLLLKGEQQFLEATLPFKDQKVELLLCNGLANDNETNLLWNTISGMLVRAKWDVHSTVWSSCRNGTGTTVSVSLGASDVTKRAADALGIVLSKLLWGNLHPDEFAKRLNSRRLPTKEYPYSWPGASFPAPGEPPIPEENVRVVLLAREP
jgi:hypothetical protein